MARCWRSSHQGTIKTWNDPQITALNPGVNLPGTTVVPLHLSDGSDNTLLVHLFTHYLAKQDPDGWGISRLASARPPTSPSFRAHWAKQQRWHSCQLRRLQAASTSSTTPTRRGGARANRAMSPVTNCCSTPKVFRLPQPASPRTPRRSKVIHLIDGPTATPGTCSSTTSTPASTADKKYRHSTDVVGIPALDGDQQ